MILGRKQKGKETRNGESAAGPSTERACMRVEQLISNNLEPLLPLHTLRAPASLQQVPSSLSPLQRHAAYTSPVLIMCDAGVFSVELSSQVLCSF